MRKLALPDNVSVNIQLGAAFWILLAIALIILFLWFKVGSAKLSEMLTASFSPSRYAMLSKN